MDGYLVAVVSTPLWGPTGYPLIARDLFDLGYLVAVPNRDLREMARFAAIGSPDELTMETIAIEGRFGSAESESSSSAMLVRESTDTEGEEWSRRRTRSVGAWYLFCLTVPTGGLQVIWTAIMGQGSVSCLLHHIQIK